MSISPGVIGDSWVARISRELIVGCVVLLLLDAFFLRWVWIHFPHWGIWDWDYQFTVLEAARSSIVDHHQLPLWNAHIRGGVSLAGNTLNHVWAPCFLPILLFGTSAGVKLCIPIYLGLAQFGMWRLARERGQQPLGAFMAAIVFTLGGVFAQRLTHGHFEWIAIAWMPHVLVYLHRAMERTSARPIWLGGIGFAFLFLDGGPYQFALFSIFAGVYALVLASTHRNVRPLLDLARIAALGTGLAAIKLLPVYDIVTRFPRATNAVTSFYGAPSLPTGGEILMQMFVSRAQEHDPELWMPYILNVGCYVGWVPLLLAAYAVMTHFRKNAVWLAVGLLFLWISLGPAAPVDLWELLHRLPFLSALRVPARFNVFILILLALLAGEGLERGIAALRERAGAAADARRPRWPEAVAAAVALFVAVDLAWVNGQVFRVAFSIPAIEVERKENFAHYLVSPYLKHHVDAALFPTQPKPYGDHPAQGTFPAVLENRGVIRTQLTINAGAYAVPLSMPWYRGEVWMHNAPDRAIVARHITPNRLGVETDGRAGLVIFNVNHEAGWEAATADTPDPISQDGRLAVRLPAGTKHATLRYRPAAFEWGALVSGLTLALGLAFALAKRFGLRGRPTIS